MGRRSTIEFPHQIEPLLEKLEICYGLKNVVSAGIFVFSKLSAKEREKAINDVNDLGLKPKRTKNQSQSG